MSLVHVGNLASMSLTLSNAYPSGATPLVSASGSVANATAAATLAGTSGKTTHITGFTVSGSGATLGLPVIVTVTNTIGGTLSYVYSAVAGILLANQMMNITFPYPIPASATNTAIVVSCPALGLGNANNAVVAYGYQV